MSVISTVATLIRSARIDLSTEKSAQACIEHLLSVAGIEYQREHRLSDADIVDFLILEWKSKKMIAVTSGGWWIDIWTRSARENQFLFER